MRLASAHRCLLPSLFGLTALLAAAPAAGAGFAVKMATLSPDGSPWDGFFETMGKEWEAGTDGRVRLTIYPGGVAGDEPDILRKMKIGQYHAAALSVSGLADISKEFTVFEIPLFFQDEQEMFHVLRELTPGLRETLDEEGFVLLGWGYVGQVHFFTNELARTVEEMQRLKIFTWAGDEAMTSWWREGGFKPVALAATDIVTGLQTGMIDALAVPPIYAMQVQFFKQAKYFADIPLIPMMGAILITKRAWNRISEAGPEGDDQGRPASRGPDLRDDSDPRANGGRADGRPGPGGRADRGHRGRRRLDPHCEQFRRRDAWQDGSGGDLRSGDVGSRRLAPAVFA